MNKKIVIIVVSLLIILILGLTINKFVINKNDKYYFTQTEISNLKTDDETSVNDLEVYEENVVKVIIKTMTYDFYGEDDSITGLVYIGDDKSLYITDKNKNLVHQLSNENFKTLYVKDYNYGLAVYFYAISEDNEVYIISITSTDIKKTNISKFRYGVKFTNFVALDLKHDLYQPSNTVYVLSEEDKIYNINTGLRFDADALSLYDEIVVYKDKTMTNIHGYSIEDSNKNRYKIKYIFNVYEETDLISSTPIVVITEDDKFIYFDEDMMNVYEFSRKVKDVSFDKYVAYEEGNLKITFDDNYTVNFKAECSEFYCVNELKEE